MKPCWLIWKNAKIALRIQTISENWTKFMCLGDDYVMLDSQSYLEYVLSILRLNRLMEGSYEIFRAFACVCKQSGCC